ncbi:transcriptional regulator [Paenibacillus sp. J31TS4]|uniref:nickel-dependent lactate racemase n=1 Tax=Paenibacillus sp. J31TS4 TaxID=2807195 RepID=UPI001B009A21|nr:nickel-dependent lactate racemase [Paenibacillus sp. J31TS4]GIP40288.1 transcriptional regulator [Paenibacillus sp. J31TS4]
MYRLPYGRKELTFRLPDGLRPTVVAGHAWDDWMSAERDRGPAVEADEGMPAERGGTSAAEESNAERPAASRLIAEALASPIGSPPLREVAQGRQNAVILISDLSRLCPSYLFLEALLDELNAGGIPDSRIRVVVALGAHRRQTESELEQLAGPGAYRRVRVLNHSSNPADCVRLGVTRRGTPVEINRLVAEADLRIATGNIEPHRLAGMSGGAKALFPGVASVPSIEANHSLSMANPTSPGTLDGDVRRDIEEMLSFLPVHFLFNTVADPRKRLLAAFAGDVTAAHRRGVEKARELFFVPAAAFDLTIASAGGHPKDLQLYQAIKSLQNAAAFTKPGAPILLAAECGELYGNNVFQAWMEAGGDRQAALEKLRGTFVLGAHKWEQLDRILAKHPVYLCSSLPASIAELIGCRPVASLQETIDRLVASFSGEAGILPFASITFTEEKASPWHGPR